MSNQSSTIEWRGGVLKSRIAESVSWDTTKIKRNRGVDRGSQLAACKLLTSARLLFLVFLFPSGGGEAGGLLCLLIPGMCLQPFFQVFFSKSAAYYFFHHIISKNMRT